MFRMSDEQYEAYKARRAAEDSGGNLISFTIPGEPQGKARARTFYNKFAGKITTMTPEKTVNYEALIKLMFEQVRPEDFTPYMGEVKMSIRAFYGIPKSANKENKQLMLSNQIRPTKKPDADNCAKVVSDALNGIAYKDDTQVVELIVTKHYSEVPRVEVELQKIS